MSVSFRNILVAVGVSGLATVAVISGGSALAQTTGGHVINAPSFTVGGGQSNTGCCASCCSAPRQHNVNVPGTGLPAPNIVVGGSQATIGVNSYSIGGAAVIGGNASNQPMVVYGRNGQPLAEPAATSVLNDLDVSGGEEYVMKTVSKQVPMTEEACVAPAASVGPRPIQAVCIDDRGAPHPASQVFDSETVQADYSGEVFRCMAGTAMQVTYGAMVDGKPSFDQGQTMSCRKGEALVHTPGGQLSCQTQIAARNCNERSLLRRHGPGLKIVQGAQPQACVPTTRTVMKTVTKQVRVKKETATGSLVLDGGVGQSVY